MKAPSSKLQAPKGLTHIDEKGKVKMVDVSGKKKTKRVAVAQGIVLTKKETLNLIKRNKVIKGDVLTVAKIAGIMAVKKTYELIPLTHPIKITHCDVDFKFIDRAPSSKLQASKIKIIATACTKDVTGCEMEALTAVSISALTIYDMCKAVDKEITITDICLLEKSGGKSGTFKRKSEIRNPKSEI